MTLSGKTVLLTGGNSGIGYATAQALLAKGATVLIVGRRPEAIEEAAKTLNCSFVVADIGTQEGVNTAAAAVKELFGHVDILINNAAVGEFDRLEDVTWEALERTYAINVFGVAMLTAAVVPGMKTHGSGTIINIASTASQKGFAMGTIYSGTKFAVRSMTQCWQEELRRFNIRVCQINPSEVTTAFNQKNRVERTDQDNKLAAKDISQVIASVLELDAHVFVPEVTVWATNPF